jgi:hypothetical protein
VKSVSPGLKPGSMGGEDVRAEARTYLRGEGRSSGKGKGERRRF